MKKKYDSVILKKSFIELYIPKGWKILSTTFKKVNQIDGAQMTRHPLKLLKKHPKVQL